MIGNFCKRAALDRFLPVIALAAALLATGACTYRKYTDGAAEIEEKEDGCFVVTSYGEQSGEERDAWDLLMLRAAEYSMRLEKPFFKLTNARKGTRRHYVVRYKGLWKQGENTTGYSHMMIADFYPIAADKRWAHGGSKIYSAAQIIARLDHLKPETN